MLSFVYQIKDELGIHARPAGLLVKTVKELDSKVTLKRGEKTAEGTKLMAIMAMGIKCGDEVTVTIEEGDEEKSCAVIKTFLKRICNWQGDLAGCLCVFNINESRLFTGSWFVFKYGILRDKDSLIKA